MVQRELSKARRLFRDLPLAELVQGLAVYAERRRGPHLQAFETDLDAARVAIPVLAGVDTLDRLVDFLDELTFAIAVAKLERHVRFLARPIVRIREDRRLVLHRVDGAVDVLRELALHLLEHLAEVSKLPRVHVFLLGLGLVRRYGLVQFGGHWGYGPYQKSAFLTEIDRASKQTGSYPTLLRRAAGLTRHTARNRSERARRAEGREVTEGNLGFPLFVLGGGATPRPNEVRCWGG